MKKFYIFGSSEFAEMASFYFEKDSNLLCNGFVVDDAFYEQNQFLGKPVIAWSDFIKYFKPDQTLTHAAISYKNMNTLRESKFLQLRNAGYKMVSYFSSKSNSKY